MWYEFKKYNTESLYGYGPKQLATDFLATIQNESEDWSFEPVTNPEMLEKLESTDLGFNFDEINN